MSFAGSEGSAPESLEQAVLALNAAKAKITQIRAVHAKQVAELEKKNAQKDREIAQLLRTSGGL